MTYALQASTWPTAFFRARAANPIDIIVRAFLSKARTLNGRFRSVAARPDDVVEIPDRLREDAGLPPREPPRRIEWWDLPR